MRPNKYGFEHMVRDMAIAMAEKKDANCLVVSLHANTRDRLLEVGEQMGIIFDCTEPVLDGITYQFNVVSFKYKKKEV